MVHRHKLAQHKAPRVIIYPVLSLLMVEKMALCSDKQLEDRRFREQVKLTQGYHRNNEILYLKGHIIN